MWGLSKIQDALALVRLNHNNLESFDIRDLQRFKEDESQGLIAQW